MRRRRRPTPHLHTKDQDKIWFYGTIIAAPALVLALACGSCVADRGSSKRRSGGHHEKTPQRGISTVGVHAGLAGLGLLLAFTTWTRDRSAGPDRYRRRAGLPTSAMSSRWLYEDETRNIVVERRSGESGETHPGCGLDAAEAADHEPAATGRRSPAPSPGVARPQSVPTVRRQPASIPHGPAPANPHAPRLHLWPLRQTAGPW